MFKLITITDIEESLYQLGLQEKEAFGKIYDRVVTILGDNELLSTFIEFAGRAKVILEYKQKTLFHQALRSYSEGLGIHPSKYLTLLLLIELAAQKNIFPDLKALLPGCSSIFENRDGKVTHLRILDFPLVDLFENNQRFYHWKLSDRDSVLTYSAPGLALLFINGIHESGMSFSLHHKTSAHCNNTGKSIFEILFNTLFEARDLNRWKELLKNQSTFSKWGIYAVNAKGEVLACDLDHISFHKKHFSLFESPQLFFTNVSLHSHADESHQFLKFTHSRQTWIKNELERKVKDHPLDQFCDVGHQKNKTWHHPAATLASIGAYFINLTDGHIDFKVSDNGPLTKSDAIYRLELGTGLFQELKPQGKETPFEKAWKLAGQAQANFDKKDAELGYHQLQMAIAVMPDKTWKNIWDFFQMAWEYKTIGNNQELSLIYDRLKKIKVPAFLNDQKNLMTLKFEKRLGLQRTISSDELSIPYKNLYDELDKINPLVFYGHTKGQVVRLEILEIFSPRYLKDL